MKKRIGLVGSLLFLGASTFPLYILPSGQPQISHFILLVFAILVFVQIGGEFSVRLSGLVIFMFFTVWIVVRQIYFIGEGGPGSLFGSKHLIAVAFYIFNFIIFLSVFAFTERNPDSALRIAFYAFLAAVAVAVGAALIAGSSLRSEDGELVRAVGSFNNPNQLGYFSLCAIGVLLLIWRATKVNQVYLWVGVAGCIYLCLLSLSKSAIISCAVYSLCMLAGVTGRKRVVFFFVFAVAVAALIRTDFSEFQFASRLSTVGLDNDDSLEGRGYGLIFRGLPYFIFGSGEGYAQMIIGHEVHSTFFSVAISYGIVGLVPILLLIISIFGRLVSAFGFVFAVGLLSPTLLYGVAHNGSRFSIFWLFLAICSAVAISVSRMRRRDALLFVALTRGARHARMVERPGRA